MDSTAGEWQVDFTVNPPAYRGTGTLEKVALVQVADAMHDAWITGTASVEYRADTLGLEQSGIALPRRRQLPD